MQKTFPQTLLSISLLGLFVLFAGCDALLPTYVVKYDANGATSGAVPEQQTKTHWEPLTLMLNTGDLARTGYIFAGWNTSADGTGIDFPEGASYGVDADITLYAKWREPQVGSPGPASGIVFYDKGSYSDGWRYLEAASEDQTAHFYDDEYGLFFSGTVWGGIGTYVGGTSTGIGTGLANTTAIVTAFGDTEPYEGRSDYAAKLCADLELDGYSDWFLPSKDELDLMYLQKDVIEGVSPGYYWSSSQINDREAWHQQFGGNVYGVAGFKTYTHCVRAARAF